MLVSAFYGYQQTMDAYKVAVKEKYRFFSFGDAMLVVWAKILSVRKPANGHLFYMAKQAPLDDVFSSSKGVFLSGVVNHP